MKIFVVMSNDFPDCVFAGEPAAELYCSAKNQEQRDKDKTRIPRIYYRWYEFEVRAAS